MEQNFCWRCFRWSISFLLLLSFGGLFGSCAAPSKSRALDISDLTPEDIQSRVSRNFKTLKSFQGKARVIIELPGSGNQGFSEIFINFPDSVFVKTEAILGIDIGALFIDRRYFGAYAPRENTLYYGEAALLDLRDFLEIELSTEELYEVLTGLNQISISPASEISIQDGSCLITTPLEEGEMVYWVDPKKFVVLKSQLFDGTGEAILTKEFQRFRKNKGVMLPKHIRLTRPQARERITVYYTKQEINRPIEAKNFKLRIASNAKRIYWGDIDRPKLNRKLIK